MYSGVDLLLGILLGSLISIGVLCIHTSTRIKTCETCEEIYGINVERYGYRPPMEYPSLCGCTPYENCPRFRGYNNEKTI